MVPKYFLNVTLYKPLQVIGVQFIVNNGPGIIVLILTFMALPHICGAIAVYIHVCDLQAVALLVQ